VKSNPPLFRSITYMIRSHRKAVQKLSEIAVSDVRRLGLRLDFESLELVLTEILTNALTYGNLQIPHRLRGASDEKDFWRLVALRERDETFCHRAITMHLEFLEDRIVGMVEDEGSGFDWRALKAILDKGELPSPSVCHGRGIFIVQSKVINLFWNEKGNQITFTVNSRKPGRRGPRHSLQPGTRPA
jgi:anti-sigma regulatory factor (Ser/Thr protein kinase)